MIELNCSYEESKKILELGYDFSNICWIFRRETPSFKMNLMKIDEDFFVFTTPEGESFGDQIDRSYSSIEDVLKLGYVPIIPKAALEACLPHLAEEPHIKNARIWLGKDLYAIQEDCIYSLDSDDIGYGSYFLERLKDRAFESTFEAFLWGHENYPEELKKRFKEVMG